MNRLQEALEPNEDAYALWLALVTDFNNEDDRFHLAVNRDVVGELLMQAGRLDDADQARREAQKIWIELVAEFNHEDHRVQMALNQDALAEVDRRAGRLAEAAAGYRCAIDHWEKLAVDFPRQLRYAANQIDRLVRLSQVLRQLDRYEEVEQAYRQVLKIGQQVAAESPADAWYARVPAAARYYLGDLLLESNRLESARQVYTVAIENYERLMQDFPDYAILPGEFLHAVSGLATVLVRKHRPEDVGPLFERAHNNLAGRAEKASDTREYQTALSQIPFECNNVAWQLATSADVALRDGHRAVDLARRAIELAPQEPSFWKTLGTALYRSGDRRTAIETLKIADELMLGQAFSHDAFFIAMAHWQVGDADAARKWYVAAARWMEKGDPKNEELVRIRAEAAALVGISEPAAARGESPSDDRQLLGLVLEAWPDAAWPSIARGRIHQTLGKRDEAEADIHRAVEAYTRLIELQPEFSALRVQRAGSGARGGHRVNRARRAGGARAQHEGGKESWLKR